MIKIGDIVEYHYKYNNHKMQGIVMEVSDYGWCYVRWFGKEVDKFPYNQLSLTIISSK